MLQQHSCSLCWFTCNLTSIPKLSIVAARGSMHHCVHCGITATNHRTHTPQAVKVRTI